MTSKEKKYDEWRRYFFEVDKVMHYFFTQDLERMEKLQKENQELKEFLYQELKELVKKDSNLTRELCDKLENIKKENEKLKKAIEILEDKAVSFVLTEEEEKILKEVLADANQTN